jgi:hypothetical protein
MVCNMPHIPLIHYIRTFFHYLKKSYNYKCIQQMNTCFNKKENDMEYHYKLTSDEKH